MNERRVLNSGLNQVLPVPGFSATLAIGRRTRNRNMLRDPETLVVNPTGAPSNLSPPRLYPPGDLAIWIFILAELLVFGIFFAAYAFARMNHVELFDHYQATLNRDAALINTLALITASYFVVRAVAAIRADDRLGSERWLWGASLMAVAFLIVKSVEYSHHLEQGISLSTNTFYMFYLSLTFFHFMHVILGLVILFALAVKTRAGAYSAQGCSGVESGASYWHMVDLVWLILFPLVYVMG